MGSGSICLDILLFQKCCLYPYDLLHQAHSQAAMKERSERGEHVQTLLPLQSMGMAYVISAHIPSVRLSHMATPASKRVWELNLYFLQLLKAKKSIATKDERIDIEGHVGDCHTKILHMSLLKISH